MKVMNGTKVWQPAKRDVNQFLDNISALRSNREFQDELNKQLTYTKRLIALFKIPNLYHYLLTLFAPLTGLTLINNRKIKLSELKQKMQVLQKQEKIFHKNVAVIEQDLDGAFVMASENFDTMLSLLQSLYNNASEKEEVADAKVLLDKYVAAPPKDKLDTLSLFLTMEACWTRLK